jgi:DNA repair protein RadC
VAGSPHTRGHWARLRERFLKGGADALPDYELLEMLLYLGKTRGGDMKPLAKTLIKKFGSFGDVVSADPSRLLEVDGVGEVTVAAIKTVQASALRMAQSAVLNRQVLSSSDALIDYYTAAMAYNKVEHFQVLFLDRKNTLIADEQQQTGTVDPTPSRADFDMTRKIFEAGQNVGVALHDHIIIGRGMNASFKSMGLLE